jgi:AcrR family transcriptional regulator
MSPGLRERKKLETWRAIRAAALELFAARGFETVSIDDIATAADVSRTTFFNYFASKEAVVFDPDPEDRDQLLALMQARPTSEDAWTALRAVLMQSVGRYSDRLALQKKLKAASPKLAASTRDMADDLGRDLRTWVSGRAPEQSEAIVALSVNVALAVMSTAYERWDPDAPFSDLIALAAELFDAAAGGFTHA